MTSLTFTARTKTLTLAVGTRIRITPLPWDGGMPPSPQAGDVVPLQTAIKLLRMIVVEAARGRLVVEVDGRRWVLGAMTPFEAFGFDSYVLRSGASDWVVRREG